MKVEEIAEVIAKLPPDQLARCRRWFTAFKAGRADHTKELDRGQFVATHTDATVEAVSNLNF